MISQVRHVRRVRVISQNSLRRVREITMEIDAQAAQALADHALAERSETIRCSLRVVILKAAISKALYAIQRNRLLQILTAEAFLTRRFPNG